MKAVVDVVNEAAADCVKEAARRESSITPSPELPTRSTIRRGSEQLLLLQYYSLTPEDLPQRLCQVR